MRCIPTGAGVTQLTSGSSCRRTAVITGLILSILPFACAQELDPSVTAEEHLVKGDSRQRYYLIHHRLLQEAAPKQFALLLVLPGGNGSADFLPFCANVITALGTPKDFLVAELVAPVWGKQDESTIVWPSEAFPNKAARFTTEAFIDAVITDVGKQYTIHDGWIFALGWSSSGHALYNSSFENPRIRGSFIAMSCFQPARFQHLASAKGKRYYFWHSPEDTVCPYSGAETAASMLSNAGAFAILKSYKGGHGWIPYTFYADRIKEAVEWFRAAPSPSNRKSNRN